MDYKFKAYSNTETHGTRILGMERIGASRFQNLALENPE